jgi:hypothetical protein
MENKLEYGIYWNIHENLKCFKLGEQNIYKTATNIKELFKHKEEREKLERLRNFESIQETESLRLERGE